MDYPFRTEAPVRTCTKKYADYHLYKPYLSEDFHHKCGYTDCSEIWFGGKRTFQIDHLKPESKYPELRDEYSNLVYCCSYVNRAKWDDDSPNYLDPCEVDYNDHLYRDANGYIVAKTLQGQYMIEHMHLGLFRYAIMWNLDRLTDRIERLNSAELDGELKDLLLQLYRERDRYFKYLAVEQ